MRDCLATIFKEVLTIKVTGRLGLPAEEGQASGGNMKQAGPATGPEARDGNHVVRALFFAPALTGPDPPQAHPG